MSPTETPSKRLSGGAKGLLNDLLLLNEKTSAEMARGVSESYLDRDGAFALAKTLGVEPPKIKRTFHHYFVTYQVNSIPVDAYTEEEALAEARRLHDINVAHGDVHYGTRSRFNVDNGTVRVVRSNVTAVRPRAQDMPDLHHWDVERAEASDNGTSARSHVGEVNWNTIVAR